jgi:hypothetical protein
VQAKNKSEWVKEKIYNREEFRDDDLFNSLTYLIHRASRESLN